MLKKSKHKLLSQLRNIYRWKIGILLLSTIVGAAFLVAALVNPCGRNSNYIHGACYNYITQTTSDAPSPLILAGVAFGFMLVATSFAVRKKKYNPRFISETLETIISLFLGKNERK